MTKHALAALALLVPLAAHADAPLRTLRPFATPCTDVVDLRVEAGLFDIAPFCIDTTGTPMPWPLLPIEEFATDSVLVVLPDLEGLVILEPGDQLSLRAVRAQVPCSWHVADGKLELDFDAEAEALFFMEGDLLPVPVEVRTRSTRGWVTISPVPVPGS
jgi:hypothetical protein